MENEPFIGMWVQAWDLDSVYLGLGTIRKFETIKFENLEIDDCPLIQLRNGSMISGVECFWKPFEEE